MSELYSALEIMDSNYSQRPMPDMSTIDPNKPFDIELFERELSMKSYAKNKAKLEKKTQNITGYDICSSCIQEVLFRLRNTPIDDYSDSWLPVWLRTSLGNAAHEFLQSNTSQFTETELNLKVPSIKFYGKIDYAIGSEILGEIKSVPYNEYTSIVRNQRPREKDFLQIMTYTYILNNYLSEIKDKSVYVAPRAGKKPLLDSYNTKKIQFIYIAHDLISSNETESLTAARKRVVELKKQVRSKTNPFYFISTIVIDLTDEIKEQTFSYIKEKLSDIHKYLESDTSPSSDSKFIKTDNCMFCLYKNICSFAKNT